MKHTHLRRIMRKLDDSSIYVKLMVALILMSIIPGVAVTFYSGKQSISYINKELTQSYEQMVDQYMVNLDYKIERHSTSLSQLALSTTLQDALAGIGEQNLYNRGVLISNEVSRYMSVEQDYGMDNCMVYSYMKSVPVYHYKVNMINVAMDSDWYPLYSTSHDGNFYNVAPNGTPHFSFTKEIIGTNFYSESYGQKLGLIKLDIGIKEMFAPLHDSNGDVPYEMIIFDSSRNSIFTTGSVENKALFESIISASNRTALNEQNLKIGKGSYYILYRHNDACNIDVYLAFPMDIQKNRIWSTLGTTGLIILIALFFSIVLATVFSKSLYSRINTIVAKMKGVEEGNLKIEIPPLEGNDELALIDRNLHKMVGTLEESINKNYIAQLEKKESELHALQLQINPHFLYNTLETICSLAMENHAYTISDISERLGQLFRYATNKENTDYATIDQEIKNTKNYIFIQQVRFPNKFEVYYNIDSTLKNRMIPKFILQPIVENSILHGLRDKPGTGSLEISAYETDTELTICVEDDGLGMDEKQLESLNQYINDSDVNVVDGHTASIGIKNVNMRVRYCYGEQYGVRIESKEGVGTSVIIKLPLYGKI